MNIDKMPSHELHVYDDIPRITDIPRKKDNPTYEATNNFRTDTVNDRRKLKRACVTLLCLMFVCVAVFFALYIVRNEQKLYSLESRQSRLRAAIDGKRVIECLNGTNGQDGVDGVDGIKGSKGERGPSGMNGLNGTNGRPGLDGRNGTNGKDGIHGKNGKDGKDGIHGKDGVNGTTKIVHIVNRTITIQHKRCTIYQLRDTSTGGQGLSMEVTLLKATIKDGHVNAVVCSSEQAAHVFFKNSHLGYKCFCMGVYKKYAHVSQVQCIMDYWLCK